MTLKYVMEEIWIDLQTFTSVFIGIQIMLLSYTWEETIDTFVFRI